MKKLILLCTVMCIIPFATAQRKVSFGPKVGINVSSLANFDFDASLRSKVGLTAGAFIEYRPIKLLGISLDVLYSRQGAKYSPEYDFSQYTQTFTTHYINIPIMARFYCIKGLSVNVGVQPGFLVDATMHTEEVYKGMVVTDSKMNVREYCKVFDFAIPVSISYAFKFGLIIEARYVIATSQVDNDDLTNLGSNSVFAFTAGWKF